MMRVSIALVAVALLGSAMAQPRVKSAEDQKKMAAVNKLVELLEKMKEKTLEEGEKEAASYNEFACYCKDKIKDTQAAINRLTDERSVESSRLYDLMDQRDKADKTIKEQTDLIAKYEKEKTDATAERKLTNKIYVREEADTSSGVASLDSAIHVLSNGDLSLAQVQTVEQTMDTFNLKGPEGTGAEKYKFHSNDIIKMMEPLLVNFKATKERLDESESASLKEYLAFMKAKNGEIDVSKAKLEEAEKSKSEALEEIGEENLRLTTDSSALISSQRLLGELMTMCSDKAKTWEQRQLVRSNELGALTSVMQIIKTTVTDMTTSATLRLSQKMATVHLATDLAENDKAMQAIEMEAEDAESAPSLLQKVLAKQHQPQTSLLEQGRQTVIDMLRDDGTKLKSAVLIGLASKIASGPFEKVTILIQELIQRLLKEGQNEQNQKAWCDKATSESEIKRTGAAEAIADLNSELARLEAEMGNLETDLYDNDKRKADVQKSREEAATQRKKEHEENTQSISDANEGLRAIKRAIDILDKFYKVAAKQTVLSQVTVADAPDAGFESGDAYQGNVGMKDGIVGMMEVIRSDFERTITETEKEEEKAQEELFAFETEAQKSIVECDMVKEQKNKYLNSAQNSFQEAKSNLNTETQILKTALNELMELKPTCIDTGMSYEERVAARQHEIDSLNKALCVMTALQKGEDATDC